MNAIPHGSWPQAISPTASASTPGAAGTNAGAGPAGADGINAFSVTTAELTIPAEQTEVAVVADSTEWMIIGQTVMLENAGIFQVHAISSDTACELTNLKDTAAGLYLSNAVSGTLAAGAKISPSGTQGEAGAAGTSGAPADALYILQTPHASLPGVIAMSDLPTGYLTVTTTTGVVSSVTTIPMADLTGTLPVNQGGTGAVTAAAARTALGVAIGSQVQAYHANLGALAGIIGAANFIPYFTGVGTMTSTSFTALAIQLVGETTAAAMRTRLGISGATVLLSEVQTNGTSAGTFTSGSWATRALNTIDPPTDSFATLAANKVTLPAGTYRVRASAPGYACGNHKIRLNSDGGVLLDGTSETSCATNPTTSRSVLSGGFTLAVQTDVWIEHRCQTTAADTGLGNAATFGVAEVYTVLEITQE